MLRNILCFVVILLATFLKWEAINWGDHIDIKRAIQL